LPPAAAAEEEKELAMRARHPRRALAAADDIAVGWVVAWVEFGEERAARVLRGLGFGMPICICEMRVGRRRGGDQSLLHSGPWVCS
jgi:hypothetical protein